MSAPHRLITLSKVHRNRERKKTASKNVCVTNFKGKWVSIQITDLGGKVNLQKLALRQQSRCRRNDNNRRRECSDTGEEKIDGAGGGDMTDWQKNTFHFRHGNTGRRSWKEQLCFSDPLVALGVCLKDPMLCKIHFTDKNMSTTSPVACVTLGKVPAKTVHRGSHPLWRHKGHRGFAFRQAFAGYFCWITNEMARTSGQFWG